MDSLCKKSSESKYFLETMKNVYMASFVSKSTANKFGFYRGFLFSLSSVSKIHMVIDFIAWFLVQKRTSHLIKYIDIKGGVESVALLAEKRVLIVAPPLKCLLWITYLKQRNVDFIFNLFWGASVYSVYLSTPDNLESIKFRFDLVFFDSDIENLNNVEATIRFRPNFCWFLVDRSNSELQWPVRLAQYGEDLSIKVSCLEIYYRTTSYLAFKEQIVSLPGPSVSVGFVQTFQLSESIEITMCLEFVKFDDKPCPICMCDELSGGKLKLRCMQCDKICMCVCCLQEYIKNNCELKCSLCRDNTIFKLIGATAKLNKWYSKHVKVVVFGDQTKAAWVLKLFKGLGHCILDTCPASLSQIISLEKFVQPNVKSILFINDIKHLLHIVAINQRVLILGLELCQSKLEEIRSSLRFIENTAGIEILNMI